MPKILRKIGRANKVACQFKFTCTFEYIDLTCVDGWKPEKLHVVWLRGHRRADTPDVQWVPNSDSGNAIDGRGTFDPPIASSLLVTLYQTKEGNDFDQKEYKFYIENEGANGKKILASFNCNIADFAGIPSEKHALDMTFKPVSRKINKALLGLTMESEFIKKGRASDDDMMSTFSRVSGTHDDMIGDEDDDDPSMSASNFQNLPVDTSVASKPPDDSITSNGTDKLADGPPSDALVGILKKPDFKSATESGQATSEVKDNQVANDAVHTKNTPTSVVNSETTAANVTGSELPTDNVQQQDSQHKSSFIADVMVSTEVKSKVEGLVDGAPQSISSDKKHPPDQKYSSTTANQLPTEQVPPTIDEIPPVSTNQDQVPPISTDQRPPVMVDMAPTVTVDQAPTVNVDQAPTVNVDQAPTVMVDQAPTKTDNQFLSDQKPSVTVNKVPPVVSTQVPQPQVANDNIPPVADNQVLPVITEQGKPDQLPAGQIPPVTADQTAVDQKTANIDQDQGPQVTINQVTASENQASVVATVTADQATQPKLNQVPEVTVSQDQAPPVMDNQVPPVTDQKPPTQLDQMSPVVIAPVTTDQVVATTVDQAPSVITHQTPSIPSIQKPPDQELVKAAVQVNPTVPLTDVKQTNKQSQPPVVKGAQSKSGKTKKKSAKEDVTPPEASLAAAEASVKSKYIDAPESQDLCWLPDDIPLINFEEQPVVKSTLDQMDIIALYFSAEWCPPCKKFVPKLTKFYNYLKEEDRKFQLVYVPSDNTKEGMLAYMKDQQMPWVGLNFDSPLGEQLRTNFKVAAIPLLVILSRNGEVISDNAKKPVDSASSSQDEMTRLYNKWMRKLLEIKGLPVPEEEPEKKGGIFSSLFSGGKKKDKDKKHDKKQQSPAPDATEDHIDEAPPVSKHKVNEELLREKEQLEREKSVERQKVQEKTKKLHDTLEINAQMQKELEQKDEMIRILEAKNETLKQTAESKTNEVEELKQKLSMLETELSSKAAEEKKLQDEKRELLANISLHGWLCKKGIKGPTAASWRRRYFRIEEGSKLTYYKTAGEGPPQGFIDIDKITSVITPPGAQQDKNNCTFHLVTDGRTYELLAHDENTMKKWISSLQYMKEWRAKQKREAQQ